MFKICWLCLKGYTENHYAMYNVSGCPGMRYESDSGYKWRKNPCLKFLWYLFSCLLGFLGVILIIIFYLLFGCAYEFVKCYTKKKILMMMMMILIVLLIFMVLIWIIILKVEMKVKKMMMKKKIIKLLLDYLFLLELFVNLFILCFIFCMD